MVRLLYIFVIFIIPFGVYAGVFQDIIDNAPDGGTVTLAAGVYDGNVTIGKRLTIIGEDGAIIKGTGSGNVVSISASGVTLSNLTIMRSGESQRYLDSCIHVKDADNVTLSGNKMSDCLFGINVVDSDSARIERNRITSKPHLSQGEKGDGIRFWYSNSSAIRENTVDDVRDVVFWYSSKNNIENNTFHNSRYGVHFMYTDDNIVVDNKFLNNTVGVFVMYSQTTLLRGNEIFSSFGETGIGLGFVEVADSIVENNSIMYNTCGLYMDITPYREDGGNIFRNNKVRYNTIGVQFEEMLHGNEFEGNEFFGNIETVASALPDAALEKNVWRANFWDSYQGFDRDGDGFGDTPHEHLLFAERLLHYNPPVRFFFGSPVMNLIDFVSRLMPVAAPVVLARDALPRMETAK